MRKIVLVCNGGMSTSLLTNAMREAAEKEGYDCTVNAYGVPNAGKFIEEADIVLVGPQISFEVPSLQAKFPGQTFMVVDTMDYGLMKGKKVLHQVQRLLGDREAKAPEK